MSYPLPRALTAIDNRELPVTLEDLKDHVRVEHEDQQRLLLTKIQAAVDEVEQHIDAAIMERSFVIYLGSFAEPIVVPNPPLLSVVSVKYLDTNEVEQTVSPANYRVMYSGLHTAIIPVTSYTWPNIAIADDAVRVTYTAGWARNTSEVPFAMREAVILRAASRYTITEEGGTGTVLWSITDDLSVRRLLAPFRRNTM